MGLCSTTMMRAGFNVPCLADHIECHYIIVEAWFMTFVHEVCMEGVPQPGLYALQSGTLRDP